MGQTISEKILAKASDRKEVSPGEVIYVKPDLATLYDWHGFDALSRDIRIDPAKVVFNFDHFFIPHSELEAKIQRNFRSTVQKYGIKHFYDIGRGGIGFHLLAEKGHIRPGILIVHADPHVSTFGALGAYAVGIGGDIISVFLLGEVWLKVPGSIKCVVNGQFQKGVMSRDLFEYILKDLGPDGALDDVFEFSGPAIDAMSIDSRFVLCNSIQYISAQTAIINPDQVTLDYVRQRTDEPLQPVVSDPDAVYVKTLEYDVSTLEPQVVTPPDVFNVKNIGKVAGTDIDQVFIGSCASARMEDLRLVAQIWEGMRIHPRVRAMVIPITQAIYEQAAKEGLLAIFAAAGAVVGPPTCGPCYGGFGTLLSGEVCLSTSTLNIPGRMGSTDASIYLSNPATAAASAIEGKITDPRTYLQ
ncbi:aconitase/3-isopropylmalate dehydratase large subunit family protein [Chloroflexota bacterium]